MALNTLKCNHLTPLGLKGLTVRLGTVDTCRLGMGIGNVGIINCLPCGIYERVCEYLCQYYDVNCCAF